MKKFIISKTKFNYYALTSDMWKSIAGDGYFGLTCVVMNDFQKMTFDLACVEFNSSHTSENIKQIVCLFFLFILIV